MQTLVRLAPALALGCGFASAHAASFDCAKASTTIEHMVCSTPELSMLDERLDTLYNRARLQNKVTVPAERAWIAETQGRCATAACLVQAYAVRVSYFEGQVGACPVTSKALLGDWAQVSGNGFEEIRFSIVDGTRQFETWLHHRPQEAGTWTLQDCALVTTGNDAAPSYDFIVEGFAGGKLRLHDRAEKAGSLVLRRVKP